MNIDFPLLQFLIFGISIFVIKMSKLNVKCKISFCYIFMILGCLYYMFIIWEMLIKKSYMYLIQQLSQHYKRKKNTKAHIHFAFYRFRGTKKILILYLTIRSRPGLVRKDITGRDSILRKRNYETETRVLANICSVYNCTGARKSRWSRSSWHQNFRIGR